MVATLETGVKMKRRSFARYSAKEVDLLHRSASNVHLCVMQ